MSPKYIPGEQALNEGLSSGDIMKLGRLYFMKSQLITNKTLMKDEQRARTSSASRVDFQALSGVLSSQAWTKFAILGERQKGIENGHNEVQSKPPSSEAMEHLETGIDQAVKLVSSVRKQAAALTTVVTDAHKKGEKMGTAISDTVARSLDAIDSLEKNHLSSLQNLQTRSALTTTDSIIKSALSNMATPMDDVTNLKDQLLALTRTNAKKMKKIKPDLE